MKLVIVCGPPAAGKMTVGRELGKLTGYKLFHNHMSLELVNQFFDWSTPPFKRLDKLIRFGIFKEVAKSDLSGLIFTIVWAFDQKEDNEYINEIEAIFEAEGAEICFVELKADLTVRLERNKHPDRLKEKESKRNVERSEKGLLLHEKQYRMNSLEDEFLEKKIYKIDNTDLSAKEVAMKIKEHFLLEMN